ncbi:MAG: hypothetical protein RL701_6411 [Pseudomonadota bacterium]
MLPCVVLALAAWCVAAWRAYVILWCAPVDLPLFRSAIAQAGHAQAGALCRALPGVWAAESASSWLQEHQEGRAHGTNTGLRSAIAELQSAYAFKAEAGLAALHTFARMALPLALGCAIFVLSRAFDASPPDVARVEQAVATAIECVVTGVLTTFFCRSSVAILQAQANERLQEIRAIGHVMRGGTPAVTRANHSVRVPGTSASRA